MGIIDEILEYKRKKVKDFKNLYGREIVTKKSNRASFAGSLKKEKLSVIAEIKPKSPSHGVMSINEDLTEVARIYTRAGVDAISVLTDDKFFGGGYELLKNISSTTELPLLAKDFIIDPVQIDLAIANNASAILLISEILDDKELQSLYEYASTRGIEILLEAHKKENVKRCVELGAKIIGINNRNLFTLEEDINTTIEMRSLLPDGIIKLALSSIKSREDAIRVAEAGYDGILVGSVIMKSQDKLSTIKNFLEIRKPS